MPAGKQLRSNRGKGANQPQGTKHINMKTVKQWLNDAEYFWKKQALQNMVFPNRLVGSLSEAIAYAFLWGDSPEKVEF